MMICGGGSSIPGLAACLLREMRGLAPQSVAPGIYGVPVRNLVGGLLRLAGAELEVSLHGAWLITACDNRCMRL